MPRFSECWRCGKTSASVACLSCEVAKYCSNKCKINDVARHTDAECRPVSVINTCLSCRKVGTQLQKCTGCYRVFYCDVTCQKNHRTQHKAECKRIVDKVKLLASELDRYFPAYFARGCIVHYYWGNVPAYDYLNLLENEGVDYSFPINILVLGVGDLRNVVLTCASLPKHFTSKVNFTLNDSDRCVLARLVLLLYMMIKCDSSASNVITEIWYSLSLSEKTYNYLCASLNGLLQLKSASDFKFATCGLIIVDDSHFKKLQEIWRKWLHVKVEGTKIIANRREEAMKADSGSFFGKINYYNCIPREHVASAKKYMEDGGFRRTSKCSFAENSTLTGPPIMCEDAPFTYAVPTSVLPFVGWDYIEVEKFKHNKSLVTMFGNYIEHKLSCFMEKLTSKQVSFDIILGDCLKIDEYLKKEEKYDRILTSNLMDYILLPELLRTYSDKLNRDNPFSTLITECQNWVNFCPDADVSMMPFTTPVQTAHFRDIVMQDTNDPVLANDGGTTFREYLDNLNEWQDYLRALFYVFHKRYNSGRSGSSKLPILKDLGSEFQLRLRDGARNENRIIFFKPVVNQRRVTMITGLERYLEWVVN